MSPDLVRRVDSLVDLSRDNRSQGEVVAGALMAMKADPSLSVEDALKAGFVAMGFDRPEVSTAVCPLCDEVSENPEGECSETFCCKACRGEVKANLWQPSWSQARSIG
jgi:hypothetical protein